MIHELLEEVSIDIEYFNMAKIKHDTLLMIDEKFMPIVCNINQLFYHRILVGSNNTMVNYICMKGDYYSYLIMTQLHIHDIIPIFRILHYTNCEIENHGDHIYDALTNNGIMIHNFSDIYEESNSHILSKINKYSIKNILIKYFNKNKHNFPNE